MSRFEWDFSIALILYCRIQMKTYLHVFLKCLLHQYEQAVCFKFVGINFHSGS